MLGNTLAWVQKVYMTVIKWGPISISTPYIHLLHCSLLCKTMSHSSMWNDNSVTVRELAWPEWVSSGWFWDHWHGFLSGYQHATAWALTAWKILRGRTELQNENQYSSEYVSGWHGLSRSKWTIKRFRQQPLSPCNRYIASDTRLTIRKGLVQGWWSSWICLVGQHWNVATQVHLVEVVYHGICCHRTPSVTGVYHPPFLSHGGKHAPWLS